jgi:hypothetical protein
MSKKYPYMPGDIILNKEANVLYYIEEISKINVFLRCNKQDRSFSMTKLAFKNQLESERGKMILVYYPVSK